MNITVMWSYIMSTAKQIGELQRNGQVEEANQIEQNLRALVGKAEKVILDVPGYPSAGTKVENFNMRLAPTCANCGCMMEPFGSCYRCVNCGEGSGMS